MYYKPGDTPATLRPMMEAAYRKVAPKHLLSSIISHPTLHLAILVTRLNPQYADLPDWKLKCVLGWYITRNAVHPDFLNGLFDRLCFYTGDKEPGFLNGELEGLAGADGNEQSELKGKEHKVVKFVKLTEGNIYHVLHATTCIPFVQERCTSIPPLPPSLYFDGALSDYMLNVRITSPEYPSLLLSDIPDKRVSPTVFDHYVPWRSAPGELWEHTSVVCPSETFKDMLPEKKWPGVRDWFDGTFVEEPERRRCNWWAAYRLSEEAWPTTWKVPLNLIADPTPAPTDLPTTTSTELSRHTHQDEEEYHGLYGMPLPTTVVKHVVQPVMTWLQTMM
ncbi:hypothetical protein HK102_012690 [Quaeritorhiza haematococci]|nr:hypothetical protein HK102_012690 [Quaeritorhiza haematococci]